MVYYPAFNVSMFIWSLHVAVPFFVFRSAASTSHGVIWGTSFGSLWITVHCSLSYRSVQNSSILSMIFTYLDHGFLYPACPGVWSACLGLASAFFGLSSGSLVSGSFLVRSLDCIFWCPLLLSFWWSCIFLCTLFVVYCRRFTTFLVVSSSVPVLVTIPSIYVARYEFDLLWSYWLASTHGGHHVFLSTSTSSLILLITSMLSLQMLTWLMLVTSVTMSGLFIRM